MTATDMINYKRTFWKHNNFGNVNTPGTYLRDEVLRNPYLSDAKCTPAGRDEYFLIPQAQINWSGGVYQQNPGF